MTHEVKGCRTCPFAIYTDTFGYTCEHPDFSKDRRWLNYNELTLELAITPDWCPLKKESITIQLKK